MNIAKLSVNESRRDNRDEMIEWHQQINGYEFEQDPGADVLRSSDARRNKLN